MTRTEIAELLARELPCVIDGRKGSSVAHQRMYELYQWLQREHPMWSTEAAELARRMWIEEVLAEMDR